MKIPWWIIALVPLAIGIGVSTLFKSRGDYDFGTPLLQLGVLLAGFIGTICFFIGHWL